MKARSFALSLVLAGTLTAPAAAHVQVRPALVAPGDPVLWTVLVPGERSEATTKVTLQVPEGVVPFSFEAAPGWERTLQKAANGALDTITWTGRAEPDGLATFRFLAATPEKPGTVTWKALQEYADGQVVRWIGGPDSEAPASVTRVEADAPRENAGGEGGEATEAPQTAPAAAPAQEDGGRDGLTLGLAIAALVVALGAALRTLKR